LSLGQGVPTRKSFADHSRREPDAGSCSNAVERAWSRSLPSLFLLTLACGDAEPSDETTETSGDSDGTGSETDDGSAGDGDGASSPTIIYDVTMVDCS
jgi:hypothetical protein